MGLIHAPWWWQLNDSEKHTAQLFKEAGYRTYLIGFNHIDFENPERLDYDQIPAISNAEETVQEKISLINASDNNNKPFMAKVGFTEVHRPYRQQKDREKGITIPPWIQDSNQARQDFAEFQGSIKYLDRCVGRIIEALEESKIGDETLILFTSDHGIPYPGAKWSSRKTGIEVPLILYQKDTSLVGGKVYPDLISNVDILPTLLDWSDIEIPERIEGFSFKDILTGKTEEAPRQEAYSQYTVDMKRDNASRSIITDKYHLIYYFSAGRSVKYPVAVNLKDFAAHKARCETEGVRPFVQLFDLKKDHYELENLGEKEEY
ncbi:MAG: sulfatase-like hydrolase/transferase, partial [Halanaerobiaceae bacterium]